jgi:hypothetical protein
MENNQFTSFRDHTITRENVLSLANDLFLIHQSFYTFLAIYFMRYGKKEHEEILRDELGLSPRGQTQKHGAISHGELWLKDLGVTKDQLTFIPSPKTIWFIRLCTEATNDEEKGEALVAAIESVAYNFVFEIGNVLKRSGFEELLSVDVHCNSEYGIEVHHEAETNKYKNNPHFDEYQKTVVRSFLGLDRHFK